MARRKTSLAEDVMDLVAMLPWWAGVLLAGLFYFGLHHIASQPTAATVQLGQVGAMMTQTLWRTLASIGQYVLPIICLAGAATSAWRRRERRQLISNVARSEAADALDGMSWQQFERLVGEGFRLQGYRVVETGGGGADSGIDLVLNKDGEKYLVQCKQWRAFRVGVEVVRELYGVMAAKGAAGGFVVTSGRFTDEARNFAEGRNVRLIDGARLRALIKQATGTSQQVPGRPAAVATSAAAPAAAAPSCPICTKAMVRRTAKRGANAGSEFWGCSGYPSCKGTRAVG
jgi:restriction system protein